MHTSHYSGPYFGRRHDVVGVQGGGGVQALQAEGEQAVLQPVLVVRAEAAAALLQQLLQTPVRHEARPRRGAADVQAAGVRGGEGGPEEGGEGEVQGGGGSLVTHQPHLHPGPVRGDHLAGHVNDVSRYGFRTSSNIAHRSDSCCY